MEAHEKDFVLNPSLDDVVAVDAWAREQVAIEADKVAPVLL